MTVISAPTPEKEPIKSPPFPPTAENWYLFAPQNYHHIALAITEKPQLPPHVESFRNGRNPNSGLPLLAPVMGNLNANFKKDSFNFIKELPGLAHMILKTDTGLEVEVDLPGSLAEPKGWDPLSALIAGAPIRVFPLEFLRFNEFYVGPYDWMHQITGTMESKNYIKGDLIIDWSNETRSYLETLLKQISMHAISINAS